MSLLNQSEGIDLDNKIDGLTFFTINTKISSGKMHGQSNNMKPLGFVAISSGGYTGISEIYAATYISIGLESIFEYLNHQLKGKTINETLVILEGLSIPFVSRNGIFKASLGCLENAFLDLCAKMKDIPLYKLFKNSSHFPKIYASGGSVICSEDDIAKESREINAMGFAGYKIRVGLQPWDADKKRVQAIDNTIKNKMVDAICGTRVPFWTYDDARKKLPFLEDESIYWLEEPLYPDNFSEYAKLQENTKIHIAAGEAYSGFGELRNLLDIGNIDIIQFDACHSGGFSVCRDISDLSIKKNRKTAIHIWGSAVAINTNFHLALSLSTLDFLEKPLIELELDSLLGQQYTDLDSLKKTIIEKPGIGIEIGDFKNIKIDNSFGFEYKW